jgi:ABC-type Na+ efflux pump permease subunit
VIGAGDLTAAAIIAAAVVVTIASWVGGWIAGRIARYDGARNGSLAALGFVIILGLSIPAGGSSATDVRDVRGLLGTDILPGLTASDLGFAAIVAGVLLLLVCLAAGALGGRLGDRYHERADAYLTQSTRRVIDLREDHVGGRGRADLARSDEEDVRETERTRDRTGSAR